MADLVTHNYTRSPAGGRGLVVFEASGECERPGEERELEHWLSVSVMASSAPVQQYGGDSIYKDITVEVPKSNSEKLSIRV